MFSQILFGREHLFTDGALPLFRFVRLDVLLKILLLKWRSTALNVHASRIRDYLFESLIARRTDELLRVVLLGLSGTGDLFQWLGRSNSVRFLVSQLPVGTGELFRAVLALETRGSGRRLSLHRSFVRHPNVQRQACLDWNILSVRRQHSN